jgi:hypothetical protein
MTPFHYMLEHQIILIYIECKKDLVQQAFLHLYCLPSSAAGFIFHPYAVLSLAYQQIFYYNLSQKYM